MKNRLFALLALVALLVSCTKAPPAEHRLGSYTPDRMPGACTLEQFGAKGDGTTDDTPAMVLAQAAQAAGTCKTLLLGARTYVHGTATTYVVPAGCSVKGQGISSIIAHNVNGTMMRVGGESVSLSDFEILGNDSAGLLGFTTQQGIANGVSGVSNSFSAVSYTNVVVRGCNWAGFYFYGPGQYEARLNTEVIGCKSLENHNYGFLIENQAEYVVMTGCESEFNSWGLSTAAGNVLWSGGNLSKNSWINVEILTGTNDGHGIVTGAHINHAGHRNVYVGATPNGFTFAGNHIISGGIELVSSVGVHFDSCEINEEAKSVILNGSTGTSFNGNLFYGLDPTVTESSNPGTYFDPANKMVDGTVPVWISSRQQTAYSFPTDANQTLTNTQSQSQNIVVAAGVITAGRTLTSTQTAASRRAVWFKNNTGFTLTFAWASGTGVTIATTKSALIGSDGTNAIILLQGAKNDVVVPLRKRGVPMREAMPEAVAA